MTPQLPPGAVRDDDQLPPGATLDPTYTLPPGITTANPTPSPGISPDPEAEAALERAPGIPLYQVGPGPKQKELPPLGGKPGGEGTGIAPENTPPGGTNLGRFGPIAEFGRQAQSGYSSGVAAVDHLLGNIAGMLESSATYLPQFGAGGAEVYKHIGEWARDREKMLQEQATERAGGNQSLPAQLTRGAVSSVMSLPIMAAATAMGGPVMGMAGMGALETADQGTGNMAKGAVEQGLMGKFIHVVGPAGRLIRVPLVMGAEYVKNVAQGVDPGTALANAMNMGWLTGIGGPGQISAKELPGHVLDSMKPRLPETLPEHYQFKSQLNPVAQHAVDYLKEEGVPLTGFQQTGNRYLAGVEATTAHTPLGSQRAREFHLGTQHAMTEVAGRKAAEVHPEPQTKYQAGQAAGKEIQGTIAELNSQANQAYEAAWEHAGDPAYSRRVQVRQTTEPLYDEAGEPTGERRVPVTKMVNMPVDVRWMKDVAADEVPKYEFLSAAEQAQSKALSIYKNILKGDDHITAEQAEEALKGLKAEARKATDPNLRDVAQGAAARLIPRLQKSIDAAVAETGPKAVEGLRAGRELHRTKMEFAEIADKMRDEPVQAFNQLSMAHDAGVNFLKEVAKRAPKSMAKIGRAYLDDLFEQATKEGGWMKADSVFRHWDNLGEQTKELLFPELGHRQALDRFFLASKITAERINTSGTALVKETQDAGINALKWLKGRVMGDILFTPRGIKFLTGIAQNPPTTPGQTAKMQAEAKKVFGVMDKEKKPPEGGGQPPAAGGGTAPSAAGAIGTKLGQAVRETAKRVVEEEEGSLTLRNLRKADRAAGSEQSTRVPSAVKATEDPLSNILTTGYKSWMRDPEMLRKNVSALLDYPNFRDLQAQVKSGALSIPDAAEHIIGRIQENLQWLHDAMPANFRDRARLWYDGAHTIARKWSGDYGSTPEQVAASMAVTSPGTDWFINAERARRLLEFWQDRGAKKWDPRMETTWRDKISKAVPEQNRDRDYNLIKGKSFKQVANDPDVAALWFRVYDEAVNPREYHTLTPEGKAGDLARVGSGAPRQFMWSDFGQIKKVLSILEDGSRENIHQNLGQEHKVRNFYNNIINPDSPREHTTIDTHAVAAGLVRPLSQMSTEVGHNFGGAGSSSSSVSGESGTYGLHKEAYRRAAASNGLLPREMQSITWEAIRSMFSPQFKRNPANIAYINSLWQDVSSGKITADAARQRALQYAGGFDRPEWFKGRWNPAVPKAAKRSSKSR